MKNKLLKVSLFLISFAPITSFAALNGLRDFLNSFQGLINLIVKAIIALAVVFFLWGMAQFILHDAGNDKTREEGKKKMLWGIVALFIMISIFSILGLISDAIGLPIKSTLPGPADNLNV